MRTKLNKLQIESISKFFSDLAKILFGSSVVGFFIPGSSGQVTTFTLVAGSICAVGLFLTSVIMLRSE